MSHRPVMLAEAVEALDVKPDGRYVDGTFGRGGHSRAILDRLGPGGRLLALDKDQAAVRSPEAAALADDGRFRIEQASFADMAASLMGLGWFGEADGVLMDLGVSSPQLDEVERGFSFMRDGPLDMRMDCTRGVTAGEWLRTVSVSELEQVLGDFGEERYARQIARAIVRTRDREPIVSTKQLAAIVAASIPRWERGQHPATRSFQAIRIRVNRELDELQQGLMQALTALRMGGRLVVISFHSLEDRIVKRFIRDESRGFAGGAGFPPACSVPVAPRLRRIQGPRKPSAREVSENPRARSAVLRAAEKLAG